jgi:hypothetical protein
LIGPSQAAREPCTVGGCGRSQMAPASEMSPIAAATVTTTLGNEAPREPCRRPVALRKSGFTRPVRHAQRVLAGTGKLMSILALRHHTALCLRGRLAPSRSCKVTRPQIHDMCVASGRWGGCVADQYLGRQCVCVCVVSRRRPLILAALRDQDHARPGPAQRVPLAAQGLNPPDSRPPPSPPPSGGPRATDASGASLSGDAHGVNRGPTRAAGERERRCRCRRLDPATWESDRTEGTIRSD